MSKKNQQPPTFLTFVDREWVLEDNDGNVIARASDMRDLPTRQDGGKS